MYRLRDTAVESRGHLHASRPDLGWCRVWRRTLSVVRLVEATLEVLPGLQPAAPLTTLGGRLIAAEENMTCGNVDTDTCRDSALTLSASGLGGVL